MEAIKSAIASALVKEYGPGCVMELDTSDRCIKIELALSRDHVIYVRPDDYEKSFLCHYAHKEDLKGLEHDANGDSLKWKQQNIAQLPRRVRGRLHEFTLAAMWYVRQAAERIEMMKGLGGRRMGPMIETFKEAKAREYDFPEPRKAEVIVAVEEGSSKFQQKRKHDVDHSSKKMNPANKPDASSKKKTKPVQNENRKPPK